MQSEKSKKAGNAPPTTLLIDFLKTSYGGWSDILLLEEGMNFNLRAASLTVSDVDFYNCLSNEHGNRCGYPLLAATKKMILRSFFIHNILNILF